MTRIVNPQSKLLWYESSASQFFIPAFSKIRLRVAARSHEIRHGSLHAL